MKFLLASNNKHKSEELSRILKPLGITVVTAKEMGIDLGDVEETGETFAENAKIKAESAYALIKMPVVADDTGLMVEALNGKPGVYTARFAGENATDKDNVNKLLSELEKANTDNRKAKFVTSIYCKIDESTVITVEGECHGKIALAPSGTNGFGYDPVFMSDAYDRTFANCTDEEKDRVSHRGCALRKLAEKLSKII